jgi:formate hydrogenlyase subunit 3/multisubunit Na+/H+ antiporter MnhD subunit
MLYSTGTQDLNKLGGLMKHMPLTAVTTIVASFSISGVPLFNGFVSKWSITVAAVQGSGAARYLPVCAVIAILTSALTLASFIKFFGVSFLSRPSTLVKTQAAKQGQLEIPWMMQLPQVLLAAMCIALGIMPAFVFHLLQKALDASRQGFGAVLADAAPISGNTLAGVQLINSALFAPLTLALLLGMMFVFVRLISKLGGARRRVVAPWLCGYVREADCHRYTAHNFYGEIKRYFKWLGGAPRPSAEERGKVKEH